MDVEEAHILRPPVGWPTLSVGAKIRTAAATAVPEAVDADGWEAFLGSIADIPPPTMSPRARGALAVAAPINLFPFGTRTLNRFTIPVMTPAEEGRAT